MTMNRAVAAIGLAVLAQALAACGSSYSAPSAPSAVTQPFGSPVTTLTVFRDQRTGFSTSDVRDAGGDVVQFNSAGELIWTADAVRLPGYPVGTPTGGNAIPADRACRCWLIVRFGTANGERRAYFTADYGHDNPGTLVDLDVAGGLLIVKPTDVYVPGTYTQSGFITEATDKGAVPVEGARVYRVDEERTGSQETMTDKRGFYEIRGLIDVSREVGVIKTGYQTLKAIVVIDGNTRFDASLVRD
jgi:hypothetical protein